MLSRFFIDRPIFATVLAILMVIIGLVTVRSLPVAQYPDIAPPTVMVTASYPGADAATVARTVAEPIEQQINGVEGMMYMSSNSSDGSYNLTVTFENGTDLDEAAVKVQNRISLADAELPTPVREQGVSVTSEASDIILFIGIEGDSDRYSALYLTNYAKLNIIDELTRIDGVGGAGAFGAGEYSMRIWLDPEKMQVRGLTPSDVASMIQSQNLEVSAGSVGAPPTSDGVEMQFTLTAQGQLKSAEEFANIVLRANPDGSLLHLHDVAKVELGSESYAGSSRVSGRDAGLIGVQQLPGANALEVATAVKAKMEELSHYFPEGVSYRVIMDATDFVNASIDEVLVTFIETTLIVMIVILLFLQSWRAVVIPMIAIPVSLIATFAVMKLFGFSLNTLTLFGMVLAIAIVVDDAIVVVEDCARLVQQGSLTPRQSAVKAMNELQGPVIGEVIVLLSVFIPTAFISGITGSLYKQFALTMATAVAFSGFNALTFTPAMCALFLRKKDPAAQNRFFLYRWFNRLWNATENKYSRLIGSLLRRPYMSIGLYFVLCIIAFWGFIKWPSSYIPEEDQGFFMTSVQLPTGASLSRTEKIVNSLSDSIMTIPEVADVIAISGQSMMGGDSGGNMGSLFVVLKPWDQRRGKDQSVNAVMQRVNNIAANYQEPVVFSINPPAIRGLGMTSGATMQILDINNLGADALAEAVGSMQKLAHDDGRLAQVTSQYQGSVPQYSVRVDRDQAKLRGLNIEDIYSTLSQFMGGSYVNDFVKFGRTYQVNISADESTRATIAGIPTLTVRNSSGDMVPFSSFAQVVPTSGQSTISRYNMYTTAQVTGTAAEGVSSSDAIVAMEQLLSKAVGDKFSYAWTGEAYQETQAGTTITTVLLFAVIITLLALAAQYESWTAPVAVILSMPTAILGTIIGCILMSQSISIYTHIGIILLLGLSAKNAILIVQYAMDFRKTGVDVRQAALDAGRIRFRPIMMTALAFVFGVMPMLFATGAGAASRISLGSAVVFGMAVNGLVGTLFVPGFWEILRNFSEKHLSGIFASADKVAGKPNSDIQENKKT